MGVVWFTPHTRSSPSPRKGFPVVLCQLPQSKSKGSAPGAYTRGVGIHYEMHRLPNRQIPSISPNLNSYPSPSPSLKPSPSRQPQPPSPTLNYPSPGSNNRGIEMNSSEKSRQRAGVSE
ncbi:hypothetical protein AAMO2058_001395000 [Amorphochlora amoebiformis]